MALVAGIDSSTQSCKVIVVDGETGRIVGAGRAAHPEEVAQAIAWLLSDAASYTAGAILDVTGGR